MVASETASLPSILASTNSVTSSSDPSLSCDTTTPSSVTFSQVRALSSRRLPGVRGSAPLLSVRRTKNPVTPRPHSVTLYILSDVPSACGVASTLRIATDPLYLSINPKQDTSADRVVSPPTESELNSMMGEKPTISKSAGRKNTTTGSSWSTARTCRWLKLKAA
ncbi:hypothetical protein M427DRAFT_330691 [Gonapodya prolifera JEL478]|uniref:Uncharacterized protein n=1 Tax=Gonapodya prolifera (strain JEL478) TaxID=1344416 RepID=A0A139AEA3_GONPJ|nr:hypothetical protein M427DRAFT_330691 [Gonapodya prolifera JEL478]|eukprot:KXS15142.1 hypothetical protein M427DRAFT_330691 [Gonapodya prolifera JEL478]